ncbi:low molecular weight protein-tyrosine-phosphatase [Variovorax sp. JS1663]|uniref:low molecular weight protein-tyrosine-phosphatase n=1 Tax=Variovorax sp. JS1663 TaxID=1851577 RepID=UPI000B3414D1|nr:low molecular weight protein-tyrosine-phosphatase [Variovorax sp. JS1663]OUL99438.1 protein tyrosine phosphatase [Variovorax sp. JS1663]
MTQRILVLCTGNVCRSPLAAAMLAREFPGGMLESAGLAALLGRPADPMATELVEALNLDLSAHRARQVTGAMCRAADLILVMEQKHKAELSRRYPLMRGKVFRLGEAGAFDVADPYRGSRHAYEAALVEIASGVNAWSRQIRQLS